MPTQNRRQKRLLIEAAQVAVLLMRQRGLGRVAKLRRPTTADETETDGWLVSLGSLDRKGPRLELWLDHFTTYPQRRFWYGLEFDSRPRLRTFVKRTSRRVGRHLPLAPEMVRSKPWFSLKTRLPKTQFGVPTVEEYSADGEFYYGAYLDVTPDSRHAVQRAAVQAAAFFELVLQALRGHGPVIDTSDDYSASEKRKLVQAHIGRERSRYLAELRKSRDEYICQVCKVRLEDVYGSVGADFAEAHHIVPLSKLKGGGRTSVDDLITVCPNCHRMLHRMKGAAVDIGRLRNIVLRRRRQHDAAYDTD